MSIRNSPYFSNLIWQHLPYIKGSTFTHDALETACTDVLNTTHTRPGVRRLAIVITDGRSRYPPQTLKQALACRDDDIGLIAVAVGVSNFIN